MDVRLGSKATRVTRDGEVVVELEDGPEVRADELVVSIGRRPHTDELGVESVGLEPGEPIEVDDRMRATGVDGDWLYAVGDVNGRVLLTHMGKYQARAAADVILGKDARGDRGRPGVAAGDLHRPAGGRGGPHAAERAGRRAERARGGPRDVAQRGRQLLRARLARAPPVS